MLDKLKPAWGVYKCRQGLESIPREELLGLLTEEVGAYEVRLFSRHWSLALLAFMMMVTCCAGG